MASTLDSLIRRPRPTAWQLFLRQPCISLARLLYSHRPIAPPQPDNPNPVTVVCISDTHNSQPQLPPGDILIHAGDLTQSGTRAELAAATAWLRRQPHPVKIVVAGNHDTLLDANAAASPEAMRQRAELDWGDVTYLETSEATLVCPNGRHLRVYGSPLSPRHGNAAFTYPRSQDVWEGAVDQGVEILITHGPPRGHLDLQRWGCVHLLRELWRVRPRLHVFGHIHEGAGTERVCFDGLQRAYERTVVDGGGVWNVCVVLMEWARARLWGQAEGGGCLLVNAAMVGGLRDDERRKPVAVVM